MTPHDVYINARWTMGRPVAHWFVCRTCGAISAPRATAELAKVDADEHVSVASGNKSPAWLVSVSAGVHHPGEEYYE